MVRARQWVPMAVGIACTVGVLTPILSSSLGVMVALQFTYLALAFGPLIYKFIRGIYDPFEIDTLYVLAYSLYTLVYPYSPLSPGGTFPATYLMISSLGIAGFHVGYWLLRRKTLNHEETPEVESREIDSSKLALGTKILLCAGLVLVGLLVRQAGGLLGFLGIGYGGDLQLFQNDKGYLAFGFDFLLVGLFILLGSRSRTTRLWAIFGLVGYGYVLFRTGGRHTILTILVALLTLVHYKHRRFRLHELLLVCLVAYPVLVIFGHVRGHLTSVGDAWHFFADNFEWSWLSPQSFGEFSYPGGALNEVITYLNSGGSLQGGLSYLRVLAIFVPRALFPNRPLTLGEWRMAQFYPDLAALGKGFGFFTIAEGYLNFGLVGVFIHTFAMGAVAGWFYNLYKRNSSNSLALTMYALGLPWVISAIRIDVAPIVKSFFLGFGLPIMALSWWAKKKGRRFPSADTRSIPNGPDALGSRRIIPPRRNAAAEQTGH